MHHGPVIEQSAPMMRSSLTSSDIVEACLFGETVLSDIIFANVQYEKTYQTGIGNGIAALGIAHCVILFCSATSRAPVS